MSPDLSELPTPLVLYDGLCRLCAGTVLFVITRDRRARVHFASMQSALGQRLLRRFGLPVDDFTTFVLVESGEHFTKSTAALRTVRYLDRPWPWLYPLVVVPRPIRDALYDWVARNRYRWFGRRKACLTPDPRLRNRFFDEG